MMNLFLNMEQINIKPKHDVKVRKALLLKCVVCRI